MTETITYNNQPDRFIGDINPSDFNTHRPSKHRIKNQVESVQFADILKKQQELKVQYEHLTLEDLKKMKLVSNTDKRPSPYLTDEKWQEELNIRKLFIKPYPTHITRYRRAYSNELCSLRNEIGEYYGMTNHQQYSSFINDTLCGIESNQRCYCYFIYQIIDLLKFHYTTLKTRYRQDDKCWEVWLER